MKSELLKGVVMLTQGSSELLDETILEEVKSVGGNLIFETERKGHICDCESWGSWD